VVTLTIAGAGTGSGTVTGTGISCTISIGSTSGDCSESALPGANPTVTLSATADSGSTFAGWSGHADCADGVVTINGNKVCTAQFTVVPQRTLTVAGAGTGSGTVAATGISCTITVGSTSGDCAESYAHGTSVTLTATPNSGSTFTGWSGHADCTERRGDYGRGQDLHSHVRLSQSHPDGGGRGARAVARWRPRGSAARSRRGALREIARRATPTAQASP
jgi:hypothetical protein